MERQIQARKPRFRPGCSSEYQDLVGELLQIDPKRRLPLIKVFDHAWVRLFQAKYNLRKEPPEVRSRKAPEPMLQSKKQSEYVRGK